MQDVSNRHHGAMRKTETKIFTPTTHSVLTELLSGS